MANWKVKVHEVGGGTAQYLIANRTLGEMFRWEQAISSATQISFTNRLTGVRDIFVKSNVIKFTLEEVKEEEINVGDQYDANHG